MRGNPWQAGWQDGIRLATGLRLEPPADKRRRRAFPLELRGADVSGTDLCDALLRLDPAAGATTSSSARDIVVAHHDHIFVELRVPHGVGGGMGLALRIDDATTNAVAFAYAPPVLDAIVPAIADATGDVLTLAGANFGIKEPSASGRATGANASSSK